MRVSLKFRDRIAAISQYLLNELEQLVAAISTGWQVEHKLDGTHGAVTADSFTGPLTGNVTGNVSGSAASFTGSLAGDVTGTQGATVVGDDTHSHTSSTLPTTPAGTVAYFSTTGTAVAIAAQSDGATNMVVIAPASTLTNVLETDNGGSDAGRIRYTGATTRTFHVTASVTWVGDVASEFFVFGLAKGGTVIAASKVIIEPLTFLDTYAVSLSALVSLATNDYLEVYVGNISSTGDGTVKTLHIVAHAL